MLREATAVDDASPVERQAVNDLGPTLVGLAFLGTDLARRLRAALGQGPAETDAAKVLADLEEYMARASSKAQELATMLPLSTSQGD